MKCYVLDVLRLPMYSQIFRKAAAGKPAAGDSMRPPRQLELQFRVDMECGPKRLSRLYSDGCDQRDLPGREYDRRSESWTLMFLLSKLGEVSRLFPEDVERTREFLLDRGIPAGSMEALTRFSDRLAIDPSFQRDVTSLVQVVILREEEAVDYMGLLGILVVAAAGAGPLDANDEQEESVREILRFLTQVRRPTGVVQPVFVRSHNVVPLVLAAEPPNARLASSPVPGDDNVPVHPVSSVPFYQLDEAQASPGRRPAIWISSAVALVVAMGSGWMLYEKSHAAQQTAAALQNSPLSSPTVQESKERTAVPAGRPQRLQAPVIRKHSPAAVRRLDGSHTLRDTSPMTNDATLVPPQPPVDAGRSVAPANAISSARSGAVAESHPVTKPLNAEPESIANGTPPADTTAASAPSVRRRLPRSVMMYPPPPRRQGGSSAGLDAAALGVVHPASIGMMASNLISSPAPAYPAAASQAQVQGEVRVRAVVDRDGKVIDARVVSGPELLRDVSVEAVQHWRYRPYMQGGKPAEVATTAVLDFELP